MPQSRHPRRLGILIGAVATLVMAIAGYAAPAGVPAAPTPVVDPIFLQPYVDKDEWRDAPVRHRYVHGGFRGTDTRFSFYFPAKSHYRGRFFQYITPVPDSENTAQTPRGGGAFGGGGNIEFSIASGGYFVETNGGGAGATAGPGRTVDPLVGAYKANAAAAQYSRVLALQMYGGKRPYGYIWGGSGGGYRTVSSMENTEGVWDGAVPYVLGSPMATPSNFTVRMYAQRILKDKLGGIADAADVGSDRDIYAGLDAGERAALVEITRMGFPPRGWWQWQTMGMGAFPVLYPGIVAADPGYFTDFWTKPGYEGFDPSPSLIEARVQYRARIVRFILADEANRLGLRLRPEMGQARGTAEAAWQAMIGPDGNQLPVAIEIDGAPAKPFQGADLMVETGAGAGQRLSMQRIEGKIVILQGGNAEALGRLKVSDAVRIDNSNFLAAQTYHRHQVPGPEYHAWDQFRGTDGKPIYPQRPMLLGPLFTKGAAGTINNGRFHGKMILVENLMDIDALPWQGDWYYRRAADYLGAGLRDRMRLWYIDRANHGGAANTQIVDYNGVLQQALRDVAVWVEKGIPPAPTTAYTIVDSQVALPASAAARHGIQPTVTVTANGGARAEVAAGQPVAFRMTAQVPPGAGKIVAADWDFGVDPSEFTIHDTVSPAASVTATRTYTFARPGTYFATIRVTSQRQGDAATAFGRIQNLARARVVVR